MGGTGDGGGSHVWPWSDNRPVPFPLTGIPTTIKDLIGRKCRVVSYGDAAPADVEPGRITIFLDKEGRILELYVDRERQIATFDEAGKGGGMDSGG